MQEATGISWCSRICWNYTTSTKEEQWELEGLVQQVPQPEDIFPLMDTNLSCEEGTEEINCDTFCGEISTFIFPGDFVIGIFCSHASKRTSLGTQTL